MVSSIPTLTKTYHHKPYPAIDPTSPELSVKGKTVIVTDGTPNTLGASVAFAFVQAGASAIAILGDREQILLETKKNVEEACQSTTIHTVVIADLASPEGVGSAAHEIRARAGAWDVFVNNAEVMPTSSSLAGADTEEWWRTFEVHVKFVHLFAKHFLTKCRPNATYISVSSASVLMTDQTTKGMAGYNASRMAGLKLNEYLALENKALRVFAVHPGMLRTGTVAARKARDGDTTVADMPVDDPALSAGFMVWLVSEQADFLHGRFVWANWDVEELVAMKKRFEADPLLCLPTLGGWPFSPA